jgi:hypothetical protein
MRRFSRFAAVMAGLLLLTAGAQAVLANCSQNAAVFPVFQCGFKGFFAPKPVGAGTVSATWWQLGYGNAGLSNGLSGGNEGTGMQPVGTFAGNDSGSASIVLSDAKTVLPAFAANIPAGSTCSNYENSWGSVGVDGCADNPRTASADDNDNMLNRYFGSYGPGYYSDNYQVDYPMGILLKESTGKFFSVAFVANKKRANTQADRANDIGEGFFDLATVTNGSANPIDPGKNSVIPWQSVPKQRVDATTFSNPADKQNSDRILALSWTAAVAVSDGSVRPSGRALSNPGNGVGVQDQGPVIRYVVETAPVTSANPDPSLLSWSAAAETTGNTANVTVPPDTAIRLRTLFGKKPSTTGSTLTNAREGKLGDSGYDVVSSLTLIAGPLVSERVIDLTAVRGKSDVNVTFRTTSEVSITNIAILAVSGKGDSVVKTITPKEGTTGVGASYELSIPVSDLKGAKQIAIRLDGQGGSLLNKSAAVTIQ